MTFDPQTYLNTISAGKKFDVALAGVSLAAMRGYEGRNFERYVHHIQTLHNDVKQRYEELLASGAEEDLDTRIAALKHVIHDKHGYAGDRESYDSLQNANMIEVIERRKGLPVAISILYLSCATARGWEAEGLNFPAHFIIRLSDGPDRRIIDPFNECRVLNAPELRGLAKTYIGPNAELSAEYYNGVSDTDVLIRLQNNLKLRLIEMEDYEEALAIVQLMEKVAPQETRFWLDEGVLLAKTGQRQAAIDRLEAYLATGLSYPERADIEAFIFELKTSLH